MSANEQDWLFLSAGELHRAFGGIVQVRKRFLLGTSFLRRVWDLLPSEAAEAVEVTEQFLAGRSGEDDLRRAWAEAEDATGQGVWGSSWDADDPYLDDPWLDYNLDTNGFPARAALFALALVRENAEEDTESWLRERRAQFLLYRDIVGDPTEPTRKPPVPIIRHSPLAQILAVIVRQHRIDPVDMLALADTLEESGCREQPLLEHCREPGPHFRGCWAVERLLGRPSLTIA